MRYLTQDLSKMCLSSGILWEILIYNLPFNYKNKHYHYFVYPEFFNFGFVSIGYFYYYIKYNKKN